MGIAYPKNAACNSGASFVVAECKGAGISGPPNLHWYAPRVYEASEAMEIDAPESRPFT